MSRFLHIRTIKINFHIGKTDDDVDNGVTIIYDNMGKGKLLSLYYKWWLLEYCRWTKFHKKWGEDVGMLRTGIKQEESTLVIVQKLNQHHVANVPMYTMTVNSAALRRWQMTILTSFVGVCINTKLQSNKISSWALILYSSNLKLIYIRYPTDIVHNRFHLKLFLSSKCSKESRDNSFKALYNSYFQQSSTCYNYSN
jgi:hypothetical protein